VHIRLQECLQKFGREFLLFRLLYLNTRQYTRGCWLMSVKLGLSHWGKHRLTVFRKRVLKEEVQPQQDQPTGYRWNCTNRRFKIWSGWPEQGQWDVARVAGKKCLMFCWGQPKERGHLEKPDLESINIKTDLPQIRQKGVNWIDLAQDKNRRVFANTVMTFGLHNNRRIRWFGGSWGTKL